MTTQGNHQDTFIEECHRNFFTNYARGLPPHQCGAAEKHIGGLVGMVTVVVFYFNRPRKAREAALAQLALTHPGFKMETAGSLFIDILMKVLNGAPTNFC